MQTERKRDQVYGISFNLKIESILRIALTQQSACYLSHFVIELIINLWNDLTGQSWCIMVDFKLLSVIIHKN